MDDCLVCRVEWNSTLHTRQSHRYSYFSWWWTQSRPKRVEKRNHTKKNCAPSWLYLQDYKTNYSSAVCVCGHSSFVCLWWDCGLQCRYWDAYRMIQGSLLLRVQRRNRFCYIVNQNTLLWGVVCVFGACNKYMHMVLVINLYMSGLVFTF
jgi:hypothetical protein